MMTNLMTRRSALAFTAAPFVTAAMPRLALAAAGTGEARFVLVILRGGMDGLGAVPAIGDPDFAATDRVRSLTPELAKGLEFDLVVLVEPDRFGGGVQGAVDRYVAMTRATQQLVVLSGA